MYNHGDFFVMLNTQGGNYTPLMDEDEVMKFKSVELAEACAKDNLLGAHFGFEIFERGTGNLY